MMFKSFKLYVILFVINISLGKSLGQPEDASYWNEDSVNHLRKVIDEEVIKNKAKNVVLFVGDGMGIATISSGRIYKGQKLQKTDCEGYKLSFEQFPYSALSKTYSIDNQVTDSAAGATALFTGVKGRNSMLGLDSRAKHGECDEEINKLSKVESILSWAQRSGKDTGIVTTTKITDATPAGLYANINDRNWETDGNIPAQYRSCVKDIARQLVEDEPGKNLKVIMGGGRKQFCSRHQAKHYHRLCNRKDKKNLLEYWKEQNDDGQILKDANQLSTLNTEKVSKIFGLFGHDHLNYEADKNIYVPTLANMTRKAIHHLKKNKDGFFLMVEGGLIDKAHHKNQVKLALDELANFDEAVKVALEELNLEESLIVVTADHSHAFTFNGYAERGRNILGLTNNGNDAHEILSYANGPSYKYHRVLDGSGIDQTWRQLQNDKKREDWYYGYFAGRYTDLETHAGEDVPVYAIGAYAHLFRGTIEQNYIPRAIAYAACYNGHLNHCEKK